MLPNEHETSVVADATLRMAAQFAELGLESRFESAWPADDREHPNVLHLERRFSAQTFELVAGPGLSITSVVPRAGRPLFARRRHVGPKTAEAFRRAGVQYLDEDGNAWIEFGDVLIDVRGRPRAQGRPEQPRATGNLFSRGRAQVVLVLLAWPQLWEAPQREIAKAAGVSVGQAHNALALLRQAGYIAGQQHAGRAQLLDLWAAAFPTGLAERLALANYQGDVGPVNKVMADESSFISGEAAVPDLLRPTSLILYVAALDARLPIENRWRSDGEANVFVRRKFWSEPTNLSRAAKQTRTAPWPLVYADLIGSENPRARGAARDYRESHERAH